MSDEVAASQESAEIAPESAEAVDPQEVQQEPSKAFDPRSMKHKVKIEQEEKEVDYDDLIRDYQKFQSSEKRFSQAAKIRKEVDSFVNGLKSGDYQQLVKTLGKDQARELAENMLLEEIRMEQMDPLERKAWDKEQENAKLKSELEQYTEKQKQAERQQKSQQAFTEVTQEVNELLDSLGKKPTPTLVYRVLENMLATLDHTGARRDPKAAFEKVQRHLKNDVNFYLEDLPADELFKVLPPKVIKQIQKASIDQARESNPFRQERQKLPTQNEGRPKRKRSTDNWLAEKEKFFRSK